MFIAILTLLSALSISGVAIFYSVIGLATIFPGAFWPVIIMGSVLEVGKLITASWLYRQWKFTPFLLKTYLTTAVVVLSLITSMGIFGFLSKAHLEQNLAGDTLVQRVNIINDKIESQTVYIERQKAVITRSEKAIERTGKDFTQDIKVQENIINSAYNRLVVLDADVKAYTDQGKGFFKGDNIKKGVELRKQQKPERDQLQAEIDEAKKKIEKYREQGRVTGDSNKITIKEAEDNIINSQNKIDDLIIERQPLEKKLINLEAEIGPVKYIAALAVDWGITDKVDTSEAVRWVILIIICVFDPLAVLLLIAANQSLIRRFPPQAPKPQEIIDLEKPDDEGIVLELNQAVRQSKDKVNQMEKQVADWQEKLKQFNKKAPKPTQKPVEFVTDKEKKAKQIAEFEERMKAEEAELERVAKETREDIERIEKNSMPKATYSFEDEIKYDIETNTPTTTTVDEALKMSESESVEKPIAEQIEDAMKDAEKRIKPNLTEVIEPEVAVKKIKPVVGMLGQVLVDKGKVIKQVPAKPYKQNEEQTESNKWSQIKTSKKTLNDEEYHEKIERKLNDTIAKIERGELKISDLSKADQNFVTKMMESKRK